MNARTHQLQRTASDSKPPKRIPMQDASSSCLMPKVFFSFLFCSFHDTTHSDLLWFDFIVLNNTAWADQVAIA